MTWPQEVENALHEAREIIDDGWREVFEAADGFEDSDDRYDLYGDESPDDDVSNDELFRDIAVAYENWIEDARAYALLREDPLLQAWTATLDSELLLLACELIEDDADIIAERTHTVFNQVQEAWQALAVCIDYPVTRNCDEDDFPFVLLERLRNTTLNAVQWAQWVALEEMPLDRTVNAQYQRLKAELPDSPLLQGCLLADSVRGLAEIVDTSVDKTAKRRARTALRLARNEALLLLNAVAKNEDFDGRVYANLELAQLLAPTDISAALQALGTANTALVTTPDADLGLRIRHVAAEQAVVAFHEAVDVASVEANLPALTNNLPDAMSDNAKRITAYFGEANALAHTGLLHPAIPLYEMAHSYAIIEGDDTWIAITSQQLSDALVQIDHTDRATSIPRLSGTHPALRVSGRRHAPDPTADVFAPMTEALPRARDIAFAGAAASARLGDGLGALDGIRRATEFSNRLINVGDLRPSDLTSITLLAREFEAIDAASWSALVHAHLADVYAAIGQTATAEEWRNIALHEYFADHAGLTVRATMRDWLDAAWNPGPVTTYATFVQDLDARVAARELQPLGNTQTELMAMAWCRAVSDVCADVLDADPEADARMLSADRSGPATPEAVAAVRAQAAMVQARGLKKFGRSDELLRQLRIARNAARDAHDIITEVHADVLITRESDGGRGISRNLEPER